MWKQHKIPIIISLILIAITPIPLLQVWLGYMIGFILQIIFIPFKLLFNDNRIDLILIINLILIWFSIFYFYKSSKKSNEIITAVAIAILMNSFGLFVFEGYYIDTKIYDWQFCIETMVIISTLMSISVLKRRKLKAKS